jgi:hypothetical protein
MAEDWEFKSLERRVAFLEKKWTDAEETKRRRQMLWAERILWTYIVAIVTVAITLAVSHGLHPH